MALPSTVPTGVVESVFHRLVSRRATVREVERVTDQLWLVTLAGADLENRRWTPGDMIQIGFTGLAGRAYTPIAYDPLGGATTFLGYMHGDGVASRWLASAAVDEPLFLVGPRSALNLAALPRPLFFFGDETSFGTAAAIRATSDGMQGVTFCFEVGGAEASRVALDRVGVTNALSLVTREPDERHLADVENELMRALAAEPGTHCVLTGRASSIQRLCKAMRRAGISAKQVKTLAYWAPGRKGFSGVQR
jgi:ferric-chelate reductase (NADPH)